MSLATTCPWGPTWRAARTVWLPAPLARSSTRDPTLTPAMASMASVAGPIQVATVASQRAQPGAAPSHCARISDRGISLPRRVQTVAFLEKLQGLLHVTRLFHELLGIPLAARHREEVTTVDVNRTRQAPDRVGDRMNDVAAQGQDVAFAQ